MKYFNTEVSIGKCVFEGEQKKVNGCNVDIKSDVKNISWELVIFNFGVKQISKQK